MTLVNTQTGEVIEFDRAAAERRAERIRLRLDSIADSYTAVMPMIREAIEKRDDVALGYRSVSEYVSDRFGGALTRLGVEVRREVVRELTEAGMSSRSIAPIVGVSDRMVRKDQSTGGNPVPTSPSPETPAVTVEPNETNGGYVAQVNDEPDATGQGATPEIATAFALSAAADIATAKAHTVTGIDGKTYKRPDPKPAAPKATPRRALPDQFFDAAYDLGKAVDRVVRLADDDRFPQNAEKVAAKHRNDLLQAIDGLQSVINRLPSA